MLVNSAREVSNANLWSTNIRRTQASHPLACWFVYEEARWIVMELFGWVGSVLLAVCGAPQAHRSYKQKRTTGIAPSFLWMWFLGEILTLFYICFDKYSLPLIVNYSLNIFFISLIMWYYYYPSVEKTWRQHWTVLLFICSFDGEGSDSCR